jgi:hypothetical protein
MAAQGLAWLELRIALRRSFSGALLCARYFSKGVLAANGILHAGAKAQKSALLQDFAKCRPLA